MADRIRYVPDIPGVRRLMTGQQMADVMEKAAISAIPAAQAAAPDVTGEYDASFTVETTRRGGPRRNRAEAKLINTAEYADDVERRHRPLGQAVDHIEQHGAG